MTKILLPMFIGVFVGAFVVELVRRNRAKPAPAPRPRAERARRSQPPAWWPASS